MACDICGKVGEPLNSLRPIYQTKYIKDTCSECERDLNDHLFNLRTMADGMVKVWLKRYIRNLKNRKGKI